MVDVVLAYLDEVVIFQVKRESEVAQSCPTLCNPMDYSPPGSSVHGILQAKILEGQPFPSLRDLPDPGVELRSPALQEDSLPSDPPWKPSGITLGPHKQSKIITISQNSSLSHICKVLFFQIRQSQVPGIKIGVFMKGLLFYR